MSAIKVPSGNWLLFVGIVLVGLGSGAILAPTLAGESVVYLIGGVLLATGLLQIVAGWRQDSITSKLIGVIQGAIVSMAGIAVLAHPFYGLAALSLVLAIFFAVSGIWRISSSFAYRPAQGWLAVLASGVISLVLSWMIWKQWPLSGMWAIGILVGVDLLSNGVALIILAITWKKVLQLAIKPAT
jgi:uncharacterized membrane protein HdeD (DUF308 family)